MADLKENVIAEIKKIFDKDYAHQEGCNIYKNVKTELSNYNYIVLKNGNVDRDKLYEILERERFIFYQKSYGRFFKYGQK